MLTLLTLPVAEAVNAFDGQREIPKRLTRSATFVDECPKRLPPSATGILDMGLFAGTQWDLPAHCERCQKLESECRCPPPVEPEKVWRPASEQSCRVHREKRNKGKVVTVVSGLDGMETDLPGLLKLLKNECGAGGTVDENRIEVQGDHVERIAKCLIAMGYRARS